MTLVSLGYKYPIVWGDYPWPKPSTTEALVIDTWKHPANYKLDVWLYREDEDYYYGVDFKKHLAQKGYSVIGYPKYAWEEIDFGTHQFKYTHQETGYIKTYLEVANGNHDR